MRKFLPLTTIVLLNLVILLILGGYTIYRSLVTPPEEFQKVTLLSAPPKPPPPAVPQAADVKQNTAEAVLDPQPDVVPPPQALDLATSINAVTPFVVHVNADNAVNRSLNFQFQKQSGADTASASGSSSNSNSSDQGNPFGNMDSLSGPPGLLGELYDLKQTPDHQPTPMAIVPPETVETMYPKFLNLPATKAGLAVLRNYVISWDQQILDRYYKAPVQLKATQLMIPNRASEEATKAFQVANLVTARRWVIHYHGVMVPPKTASYRFLGFGDDFLMVRIRSRNVLDGCFDNERLDPSADGPDEKIPGHNIHNLRCGSWFSLEQGVPTPIQVLIGEGPGGSSGFELLIEERGDNSVKGDYPVFQMEPGDVPASFITPTFSGKTLLFQGVAETPSAASL